MDKTDASSEAVDGFIDVSTHGSSKCVAIGIIWLIFALGGGAVLWAAVSAIIWEHERGLKDVTGIMIGMGAGSALVTWLLLALAVRRFRAAVQHDCFLRSGPAGVWFRIPGSLKWSTLLFGYRMMQCYLPWEEVTKWYPYLRTINGIPSESEIVFETIRGTYRIPTMYFLESRQEIANAIGRATLGGGH
jgi:hypothetical protein